MTGERGVEAMQRMEQDPEELSTASSARPGDSPPVGEPLVASRRNPAVRPVARDGAGDAERRRTDRIADADLPVAVRSGVLDGRVAIVTAATGELGGAMAVELADRGARVLLVDDDLTGLLCAADASDGRAVPVHCDLGSESDVAGLCEFVARATTVDLVVHVAADNTTPDDSSEPVAPDTLDDVERTYREHVHGPLSLVTGLLGALGPHPHVVLVDRAWSWSPATLRSSARSLVREHLPEVEGMRITTAACGSEVSPGSFAAAVADLVVRDDMDTSDLTLGGIGPGRR